MNKPFSIRSLGSRFNNRKSQIQNLKWAGLLAIPVLLVSCIRVAEAQQSGRVPRIGFLGGFPAAHTAHVEALRQGLRELGYVEGKNILIEYRYAEGKPGRRAALAAELVRLKVEVIITSGSTTTRVAQKATTTIPIVMGQGPDPVRDGFVASLARPGGNITGLSSYSAELTGKRLEFLKEIVPKLSRVSFFGDSTQPGAPESLKETELAARALGLLIQYLDVQAYKDMEAQFRAASKGRADAALGFGGPRFSSRLAQITHLALKSRLPAIYPRREFVDAGGLMSYGASVIEMFRRVATYVDKILRGARPADLPVEQPTKFELVINLKTAKALGLTIPKSILLRVDQAIE